MHTTDLKYQVERILRWEPSVHWRPRDFLHLSERVLAHTNQWIEAHDLQEFWRSSGHATPALLDALARFADYADWADFCDKNRYGVMEHDDETAVLHAPMWEIPMPYVIVICWLSVLASVAVAVLLVWKS